jgi:hypothetical protein
VANSVRVVSLGLGGARRGALRLGVFSRPLVGTLVILRRRTPETQRLEPACSA